MKRTLRSMAIFFGGLLALLLCMVFALRLEAGDAWGALLCGVVALAMVAALWRFRGDM